jgi:predicted phosphodiesterase
MNFQIMSDIHIEFKNDEVPEPKDFITPSADVLILAGDIGSLYKYEQLLGFLQKLSEMFQIIIYVPGNQEYYMQQHDNNNYEQLSFNQLTERLNSLQTKIQNLYILNQSSIIINDILISGCTLWSDIKIQIPKFIVRIDGFNSRVYLNKHKSDVQFLKKMIKYSKQKQMKLVLVTHHCPSYKVLTEVLDKTFTSNRAQDKFVSLYVSDLEELISKDNVHTWICGHTHKNFNFQLNGTTLLSNQKGKPKDKITNFKKDFTYTI